MNLYFSCLSGINWSSLHNDDIFYSIVSSFGFFSFILRYLSVSIEVSTSSKSKLILLWDTYINWTNVSNLTFLKLYPIFIVILCS